MRFNKRLTEVELDIKIIDLKRWYMPIDLDPAFHSNKVKSIGELDAILERTNRRDLQKTHKIDVVLLCALTLMYYFSMRLRQYKSTSKRFTQWSSKRQFLKAETVFQKTMDRLLPERSEATITIMLTFFTDVTLWPFENIVRQILEIVLSFTRKETAVFNMMIIDIHHALLHDVTTVMHRLRVLYELLNSDHFLFEKPNILLLYMNQLLDYYTKGIVLDGSRKLGAYVHLRKGSEVCLRRIFERAPNQNRLLIIKTLLDRFFSMNIKDDAILEFATLVYYAAEVYKVGPLSESLPQDLMDRILGSFVGSMNPSYSLVGCRLIQWLLDRQHNGQYLVEPKLYYDITKTHLKLGTCSNIDQLFIRDYKEKFHEYFMLAIKKHCEHIVNLKALFTVVCCMILEVPCGLTSAAATCMMMVVQDYALNGENISTRCRYWMHAVVISVMSLICWVHKAPVLCKYVNQIITRRAIEAPQLNPPLLREYNVKNLNSWTRNTLFFEDWEMRYGLWKAFAIPPVS